MSPEAILRLAGLPCTASPTRLSGGDMGEVFRAGDLVVKSHLRPPQGLFPAEARGLRLLNSAGVRVPHVHWVSEQGIVMDWLAPGPDDPEGLAAQLARLHSTHHDRYGSEHPVFLGTFPFAAAQSTRWVDVLREHRLRPLLEVTRPALGPTAARLERLLADLDLPEEGPVVVHGDLWSGNVHMSAQGAALIDPSAQVGERALDLAMMRLFGGFSRRFWEAYTEALPIPAEVERSIAVHQLVFLLVHVHFFGRGYVAGVERTLRDL